MPHQLANKRRDLAKRLSKILAEQDSGEIIGVKPRDHLEAANANLLKAEF